MLPLWAIACTGGPPTPAGTLLLVSEGSTGPATWAVSADGTGARRLGAELPGALFPGPPDPRGTHALVVSATGGAEGHAERLWLVPLAGEGDPVALSPPAQLIRNPTWAADGGSVVFESDAASFRDLYRVQRAGSFEPDLAADGRIVFDASRDGNAELYVMAGDGTGPVRLTRDPGDDLKPHWSPDGASIAWIAQRGSVARVWVMRADGTEPRILRATGAEDELDLDFAWSPDGRRIAVVVQPRGGGTRSSVQVVEVDGGATVAAFDGPGMDEHPAWSPDGAWIAYSAGEGKASRVVLVTADGRNRRTVSAGGTIEWLPRWVPSPGSG
jgi:TolB protein